MLNLVVIRVGGVLLFPLGRMEWGFERISGGAGVYFIVIPGASWETGLRSDSGMMCGVESWPSKKPSGSLWLIQ
jgi:hypothetical protein